MINIFEKATMSIGPLYYIFQTLFRYFSVLSNSEKHSQSPIIEDLLHTLYSDYLNNTFLDFISL